MSNGNDSRLQDLEIFARALEKILRKLIRFLVGRISLVKLIEMTRTIYIQESEKKLKLERPKRNVSLTQLAVLTGIDTRTLTKVRNNEQYWSPIYKTRRFLKEMTPEMCILDLWTSDSRYLDAATGWPRHLELSQGENSFEQLVNEAVTSRGVTAQSLLAKLISNGSVQLHEHSNTVELLKNLVLPKKASDALEALELGLVQTSILLDTVFHNYNSILVGNPTFFQRGSWTHRLSPKNRVSFEKKLRAFLEKTDDDARKLMLPFEEKYSSDDQITAGVSLHYFEDDSNQDVN